MGNIKMVVFDMAGTTVKDQQEVEKCFIEAANSTGLEYDKDQIVSMMGWPKRLVFKTLWEQNRNGFSDHVINEKIETSYQAFKTVIENHYRSNAVLPTEGTMELFELLKSKGIKIALTTGFYRGVTDIILKQLGWDKGLNENYIGNGSGLIDVSITSDEVKNGRPAPDMILKAMSSLSIHITKQVVNIGDTPSDLESGKNAQCLYSLGVTNGTHTREQLQKEPNDGLLDNILQLKDFL